MLNLKEELNSLMNALNQKDRLILGLENRIAELEAALKITVQALYENGLFNENDLPSLDQVNIALRK